MGRKKRKYYYEADWEAGGVYHVYNHAVQPNVLFTERAHGIYFLELLRDRVAGFAEIFAYALIPNHYHLALRLRLEEELEAMIYDKPLGKRTAKERAWLDGEVSYHQLIGDYFATVFAMYANYFNPRVGRRGTLLNQTLRRIRVREDLISRRLIMYIHTNEVKHGMRPTYLDVGMRSSLCYYLSERESTWLATGVALSRFGGLDKMLSAHEAYVRKYGHAISQFDEQLYFDPEGGGPDEAPYLPFLEDAPPPPA